MPNHVSIRPSTMRAWKARGFNLAISTQRRQAAQPMPEVEPVERIKIRKPIQTGATK